MSSVNIPKWTRLPGQQCHITDTVKVSLSISNGGSSSVSFSPTGRYIQYSILVLYVNRLLAVGCSTSSGYVLKIYKVIYNNY